MAKYKVKDKHRGTLVSPKGSNAYIPMQDLSDKQIEILREEGFKSYFTVIKKAKEEDKS